MRAIPAVLILAAVAVLGALLLVGATTADGHAITGPLGDAATAVGRAFAGHAPDWRRVAGQGWVAFGIGSGAFALCMFLVPPSRTGRGVAVAGVAAALLGLALYSGGTR